MILSLHLLAGEADPHGDEGQAQEAVHGGHLGGGGTGNQFGLPPNVNSNMDKYL